MTDNSSEAITFYYPKDGVDEFVWDIPVGTKIVDPEGQVVGHVVGHSPEGHIITQMNLPTEPDERIGLSVYGEDYDGD